MTLLVIYHNVAKCNSGKVKHKTSAGQRSPSLSYMGQSWALTGLW